MTESHNNNKDPLATPRRESRGRNPDIDEMRYELAEHEAMNMNTSDIILYLIDGFEGLDNISDLEIEEAWNELFGDKA